MSEARHRGERDRFGLALSPAELELESVTYPPPWRSPGRHSTLRLTNLRTIWSIKASARSASPAYFPLREGGGAVTGSASPQLTGGDVNDADAVGFHGPDDPVQFSTSRSLKDPLVLPNGSGRSAKMNPNPALTGGFPAADRTKGARPCFGSGGPLNAKTNR
jgi:hypothetical protein